MKKVLPYEMLAVGYDLVMEHVDYEAWAHHIQKLIVLFHQHEPEKILELGCGTGSLAFELQPLADYQYLGLDLVPSMIHIAKENASWWNLPIQFEVADFTNFQVDMPLDVIILLQDGINYILQPQGIYDLFRCAYQALTPGGLFIFDQSTPYNSLNNEAYFNDSGEADAFRYVRTSKYDKEKRLHTTQFQITLNGEAYFEEHTQFAYTKAEMENFIETSKFKKLASLDSMSMHPAHDESERIHWVLQKSN